MDDDVSNQLGTEFKSFPDALAYAKQIAPASIERQKNILRFTPLDAREMYIESDYSYIVRASARVRA
jgi:hypothetical protein